MGITSGIQFIDDSQFTQLIIHGFIQWDVTSHVVNECQGVWVFLHNQLIIWFHSVGCDKSCGQWMSGCVGISHWSIYLHNQLIIWFHWSVLYLHIVSTRGCHHNVYILKVIHIHHDLRKMFITLVWNGKRSFYLHIIILPNRFCVC